MRFVRTSQDANSHNKDACCGQFYASREPSVPDNEKSGGVVYCYTKCGNCGAVWRDGFRNANPTEHVYDGHGDHPFLWEEFDFEYSHIDTNKRHDGRVSVVYTPTNNPLDTWEEEGYDVGDDTTIDELRDEYSMDEFRKKGTYVFRFCEVAKDTVSPIPKGAVLEYDPPNNPSLSGRVTALDFEDDALTTVTVELIEPAGQYKAGADVSISTDDIDDHGTVVKDPWEAVLVRRPSL